MSNSKENLFVLTPLNFKEEKTKSSNAEVKSISEYLDKYDPLIFCRTCANVDPCLVPIFKEEGLDYSLNKKIEKYLPIQISEEDDLPLHLCYHCASTLIAWDTLIIGCVEAEKKLTALKNSSENKRNEEVMVDEGLISENIDSDDEPLITKKTAERIIKVDEKRDILQEKNDLQTLEPLQEKSKRLLEEPGLSFTIYQHQFTIHRPFIFKILNLRISDPFCCEICSAIADFKLTIAEPHKDPKVLPENVESETEGFETPVERSERRKGSKLKSPIACEDCGKILSCKVTLKNHMKTHRSERTLTCHVCGKTFRHRFNLLRHLKVIHEGVRNHVCVDCGKRYRSHGEMEDHRNVHDIKKKIVCEECGKIFLTKASFYPHKKSHRAQNYKKEVVRFDCEKCHKNFTTKKSKNQHMLIHTGEKPISCKICGKNFRTKANFSQHAKVHSDVKPFGCEHCGKAFGRKDHLKIHVRCHTGEKPFLCNNCGRGFAQMNDMKKHLNIHKKKD